MKITLSVIKADVGSIGGHIAPSQRLLETVRATVRDHGAGQGLLKDAFSGNVRGMGPAVAELEYTGIMNKLNTLDGRFQLRG